MRLEVNKQNLERNDHCVGSMSCIHSEHVGFYFSGQTKSEGRFQLKKTRSPNPLYYAIIHVHIWCNSVLVVVLASEAMGELSQEVDDLLYGEATFAPRMRKLKE